MKTSAPLYLFIFLSLAPARAMAFPEMIREGYVNCVSCHVSPNGGGVLNAYGRATSAAVLSSWGGEDEAKPFYGVVPLPDFINAGLFTRGIQTVMNNPTAFSGTSMWMQLDGEASAQFGGKREWLADASIGVNPNVLNGTRVPGDSALVSRHDFLMYRPGGVDDPNEFRIGKFLPDYGVNFSNHTIATRQGIGFDVGNETYNIEYGYQGDQWSGSVTADFGDPFDSNDSSGTALEKGGAITAGYVFSERLKAGVSAYFGSADGNQRELLGPYLLWGLTKSLYALVEADFQRAQPKDESVSLGLYSYEKLGYELLQGLHVYGYQENFFSSLSQSATQSYSFGGGIEFYPRPHFSLLVEVEQNQGGITPTSTSGFLLGTLYL